MQSFRHFALWYLKQEKRVKWSAVPVPCWDKSWLKLRVGAEQRLQRGWWPMLSHRGIFFFSFFLPSLNLHVHFSASKPISQPWSLNPSWGPNPLKLGFGPQRLDFGLEVGIWASRLGFEPQGCIWAWRWKGGYKEGEGEGENFRVWKHRSLTL